MPKRKRALKENITKSPERIQPPVQPPVSMDNRVSLARDRGSLPGELASAVEVAFRKGGEEGYNRAKQEFRDELSYNAGARNVITIAENYLAGTLGLKSRQDLAECHKVPSWWIATLMSDIWYKNPERKK